MNKKSSRFIGTKFPTELAVKIDRYGKLNHLSTQKALIKLLEMSFNQIENRVSINLANNLSAPESVIFREPKRYGNADGISFENERVSMHDIKKAHPCRSLIIYED